MNRNLAHQSIAVIGYGITGRACVRFLLSQEAKVCVLDRDINIQQKVANDEYGNVVETAVLETSMSLSAFSIVVLSPGVDPHQTCFEQYKQQGGCLIGDIELFAWFNKTPLIGITGSNGKTTVTDMLGKVLKSAGLNVELAGNYGKCAVDLLIENETRKAALDVVVLELSSYQLEMTESLQLEFATVLNITHDHLDRHGSFEAYKQAKQRIFKMAKNIVACREEPFSYPPLSNSVSLENDKVNEQPNICAEVSMQETDSSYCIVNSASTQACVQFNGSAVFALSNLHLQGVHNHINAMIVLALCDQLSLERSLTVPAICNYTGLAHRFEVIKQSVIKHDGEVLKQTWINDSKATNIGACQAALSCFVNPDEYLILIAGGDAKGVDLLPLKTSIEKHVDQLIVMGKDAPKFMELVPSAILVKNIQEAVASSLLVLQKSHAANATVLLSPACASLDMFANYQERGEVFTAAVHEQVA
jgi:UDP-N-acetylmuramoylalanine--D-glutamate ligase